MDGKLVQLYTKEELNALPTFSQVLGVQNFNGNMLVRRKEEIQNLDFDMIDYYFIDGLWPVK